MSKAGQGLEAYTFLCVTHISSNYIIVGALDVALKFTQLFFSFHPGMAQLGQINCNFTIRIRKYIITQENTHEGMSRVVSLSQKLDVQLHRGPKSRQSTLSCLERASFGQHSRTHPSGLSS